MTNPKAWSAEDTDIARQMFVNKEPSEAFIAKLGRSESASRERVKRANERVNVERRATAGGIAKAPAQVVEDAVRRARAPRSLTALAFGDPPPGYSALDRRNRAEASA
jgi:hypothetical protein